eukprot:RCo005790
MQAFFAPAPQLQPFSMGWSSMPMALPTSAMPAGMTSAPMSALTPMALTPMAMPMAIPAARPMVVRSSGTSAAMMHQPGQNHSELSEGMSVTDNRGQTMTVLKELGSGCFGSVFKVQRQDGKILALKVQPYTAQMDDARREIRMLKSLRHQNIISFFDDFTYTAASQQTYACIVMEFCGGGTLQKLIKTKQSAGHFRSYEIFAYCSMLADGLAYMHKSSVTHRDLKSENILLDSEGVLKISDFGRGRFINSASCCVTATSGDRMVVPPEFVSGALVGRGGLVGPKYDMWGLGCILSELVTLKILGKDRCPRTPLGMDSNAVLALFAEVKAQRNGLFSAMLEGLLNADPNARFSSARVQEALHTYLAQVRAQNAAKEDNRKALDAVLAKAPAWGLSSAEAERLWTVFNTVDKSGTGRLATGELKQLLVLLDIKASAHWLLLQLDKEHIGTVDLADIAQWWGQQGKNWVAPVGTRDITNEEAATLQRVFRVSPEQFTKMRQCFSQLDPDSSGTIPATLLPHFLVLAGVKLGQGIREAVVGSLAGPDGAAEERELSFDEILLWCKKYLDSQTMTLRPLPT